MMENTLNKGGNNLLNERLRFTTVDDVSLIIRKMWVEMKFEKFVNLKSLKCNFNDTIY